MRVSENFFCIPYCRKILLIIIKTQHELGSYVLCSKLAPAMLTVLLLHYCLISTLLHYHCITALLLLHYCNADTITALLQPLYTPNCYSCKCNLLYIPLSHSGESVLTITVTELHLCHTITITITAPKKLLHYLLNYYLRTA